ncbi:penicillin-binding protein [Cytobacillus depressus]|uniref:Penicillin-binding protein n=1 Tax=Cytobacillus depressus TaxID=1602942 RepID=A0A6L3V3R2_9BACI|nr:transglycosylase domain-containing protein [Cytobacillus depressus]KAB2334708.1 penicillin-binding protein [Cytobacillus depressus]
MRILTGYFIIAVLVPSFLLLIYAAGKEVTHVQSLHTVLDEKINIQNMNLPQNSYIKAKNGAIISEIQRRQNRLNLQPDEIPAFLKDLLIVSEDQHFYDHAGFDLPSIGRAFAVNMNADNIKQGGSTITQQLARNLYLNNEKSYNRKLSELLYAYEIERKYTKEEILTQYINAIYFQNGAYGIEAAAQVYFQKQTHELSNAELAFLAAIPNNPTLYNPMKHFDQTKARQERLIDQLMSHQLLQPNEAQIIKNEPIHLQVKKRIDRYPDYVTYVEDELKDLVGQQEGFTEKISEAKSENGKNEQIDKLKERVEDVLESGIIIETALDNAIQEKAKRAVMQFLPEREVEGAAAVIDHANNQLVALVGGKAYKKYDFNRGYQAYRQPGSAIKPLLVYAPYFERTKGSLGSKVNANTFCKNGYCPQNYSGGTYGMVTIEQAFIHSYNTPAVRILDSIGISNGFQDLANFKFSKVSKSDQTLPAAIGGFSYGMTPLELTSAYTVFANDGFYQQARAIVKVTNLKGEVLYQWNDEPIQVWSKETTDKVNQLMRKTVQAGTARKAKLSSGYAGGKTGTTNDYKDYWFIGLTDQYTTGVWVGKDRPENIAYLQSRAPQQLIWKEIMSN